VTAGIVWTVIRLVPIAVRRHHGAGDVAATRSRTSSTPGRDGAAHADKPDF